MLSRRDADKETDVRDDGDGLLWGQHPLLQGESFKLHGNTSCSFRGSGSCADPHAGHGVTDV